ncbi:response regulator [Microvirga makkahensis]|uniref:Response regulator n=1 Tax=Microvirga makkahensis TaxID=1128670 RepID=A0A7X3MSD1_9HYPH|nr:response regulator [Microvirga makkahensis]MXQ12256.1 response regulator [Microvirga makkahensis]
MTTILVVDDEFLITDILVDALEEEGFRVLTASNGRKALEVLHKEVPALVVTDFMMPLMNGLELAQAIKANPDWVQIPIILVSGAQGAIARAHPDLFAAVYDKPFRIEKVVAAVVETVGARRGS